MGTLQLRPEFFDVYLELAVEFGLPLRLLGRRRASGWSASRSASWPPRRACVFPDHFVHGPNGVGSRRAIERSLFDLRPGVTEVLAAPGRRHARAAGARPRLGATGSTTTGCITADTALASAALDGPACTASATAGCTSSSDAARVGAA